MAPLKRARMRQAQVTGNRRSRSRIIRKIIELRQKALSTMRSDKVNTDLCEVTVLRRSDCKQKCHLSGASARCFEVRAVTLLIRSTTGGYAAEHEACTESGTRGSRYAMAGISRPPVD